MHKFDNFPQTVQNMHTVWKGTSIRQETEFGTAQSITEKRMEVYHLNELFVITSYFALKKFQGGGGGEHSIKYFLFLLGNACSS